MKLQFYKLSLILFIMPASVWAQDFTIKVWTDKIPGAVLDAGYKEVSEYRNNGASLWISHVTDPELMFYLPNKEKATGTAIIICPGGGYSRLAMDHEGFHIAKWLQEMGIVGIILKYRLPSEKIMVNKSIGPLQDAQEAVRIARRRASEFNIDPDKIGVIGFSAGGHLASTISTHYNELIYPQKDNISARPDFSILIYPVISMKDGITHNGSRNNLIGNNPGNVLIEKYSNETRVTPDTPPTFLVHSSDDVVVPPENSLLYYQALIKNKVSAEMHIFQTGGHGYGLEGKGTHENWPESCKRWLKEHGYIEKGL
jgi:acetyl esterase/lipase